MVRFTLPNGMVVLLEPIEGAVSLSIGLWIKSGSRDEFIPQQGYAHFVEHMLFKGTSKHNAKELAQMIDRVGGQHNAATNREYTCYFINVVSDYLDLSVKILSDMYYDSLFDPADIEKEKGVIIEEMGMCEDTPDDLIHDMFMEAIMGDTPLGHPVLGKLDVIKKLTRESLLSFYDAHYHPENCVIALSGCFDVKNAESILSKYFSAERKRIADVKGEFPIAKKSKRLHTKRKLEQVHFIMGFNGIKRDDENRWAMYILSTILGGSMSSRLFQRVRENEGLCYSIYSFFSSYADNGVFGVYCGTSPDKYERAKELIIEECASIAKNGVTTEELADAKSFMKGNLALSLESIEVRMGQLARNANSVRTPVFVR